MNVSEYFSENDFYDSQLIMFTYSEAEAKFTLIADYTRDITGAILDKLERPGYDIDIRKIIFSGIQDFKRLNVWTSAEYAKDGFIIGNQKTTIRMDCIIVKGGKGGGYKVEVVFISPFGEAAFSCNRIECVRKTGNSKSFTAYDEDVLEKINDPDGWEPQVL